MILDKYCGVLDVRRWHLFKNQKTDKDLPILACSLLTKAHCKKNIPEPITVSMYLISM